MKRGNLVLALAAVVIFVGLFYFYGGHQTPSGQPSLYNLNAANLAELKGEFNSRHDDARLLVLLSPT